MRYIFGFIVLVLLIKIGTLLDRVESKINKIDSTLVVMQQDTTQFRPITPRLGLYE